MSQNLPELISESEALRKVNLPSTPHWRQFLRSKLPSQNAGGITCYDRFAIDELSRRISDFAKETNPPEVRNATTTSRARSGELIDRRGPSA